MRSARTGSPRAWRRAAPWATRQYRQPLAIDTVTAIISRSRLVEVLGADVQLPVMPEPGTEALGPVAVGPEDVGHEPEAGPGLGEQLLQGRAAGRPRREREPADGLVGREVAHGPMLAPRESVARRAADAAADATARGGRPARTANSSRRHHRRRDGPGWGHATHVHHRHHCRGRCRRRPVERRRQCPRPAPGPGRPRPRPGRGRLEPGGAGDGALHPPRRRPAGGGGRGVDPPLRRDGAGRRAGGGGGRDRRPVAGPLPGAARLLPGRRPRDLGRDPPALVPRLPGRCRPCPGGRHRRRRAPGHLPPGDRPLVARPGRPPGRRRPGGARPCQRLSGLARPTRPGRAARRRWWCRRRGPCGRPSMGAGPATAARSTR